MSLFGLLAGIAAFPLLWRTAGSPQALWALSGAEGLQKLGAMLCLVLAWAADSLDGPVARATGTESPAGAVLDSVLDRLVEALVFIACAAYYAGHGSTIGAVASASALAGSLLVSYVRARAQVDLRDVGFWQRPQRSTVLLMGLATGLTLPALAVIALGGLVTSARRLVAAMGPAPLRKPGDRVRRQAVQCAVLAAAWLAGVALWHAFGSQ